MSTHFLPQCRHPLDHTIRWRSGEWRVLPREVHLLLQTASCSNELSSTNDASCIDCSYQVFTAQLQIPVIQCPWSWQLYFSFRIPPQTESLHSAPCCKKLVDISGAIICFLFVPTWGTVALYLPWKQRSHLLTHDIHGFSHALNLPTLTFPLVGLRRNLWTYPRRWAEEECTAHLRIIAWIIIASTIFYFSKWIFVIISKRKNPSSLPFTFLNIFQWCNSLIFPFFLPTTPQLSFDVWAEYAQKTAVFAAFP